MLKASPNVIILLHKEEFLTINELLDIFIVRYIHFSCRHNSLHLTFLLFRNLCSCCTDCDLIDFICSKSTDVGEDVDGDRENLLDTELLPAEDFPETFPISLRNLDTDPALRIQREEAETWAASVPDGVASALKQHEAKRQEHIYEFIITEKHHCQLLKVIQKVFCEGMTTYLDMKPELLDRLFPQLDTLINLHFEFLRQLRERQVGTRASARTSYNHLVAGDRIE